MNTKTVLLFFLCALFFIHTGIAQNVSVNPLTGAAMFDVSLFKVAQGQAVLPVSLNYNTNGIKPTDAEGTAGMGWNLQAGGQVSRLVRGLPDDVTKDNAGNKVYGWMNPLDTGANMISGFSILNNGSSCTNETSDISYINSNFPYRDDTEPDLFYVNAPGLSCQLVYDRTTAKFHALNYEDVTVTYAQNTSTGTQPNQIANFTITNDRGIVYTFGTGDAGPSAEIVTVATFGGSPAYFTTTFNQYVHGITYYDTWELTGITDANGNSIILDYAGYPVRKSTDSLILYSLNPNKRIVQYLTSNQVTPCLLTQVFNNGQPSLQFNWSSPLSTGQTVISSITGYGRTLQFTYAAESYATDSYTRCFLKNFTDVGNGTPINYSFSYNGESYNSSSHSYVTALPDSASKHLDYWGFYSASVTDTTLMPSVYVNPSTAAYQRYLIAASPYPGSSYVYSLSNSTRAADTTVVAYGTLNKINYTQGGNTNIVYRSNDYVDASSGYTVKGGGVRVKQVIDSVGSGSTNNIIRNYSYVNPSGASSGKPVTLPAFAFTIPYSGSATDLTLWQYSTLLSASDLSKEDHTIMYQYSRMSQTGAGSTLYQYYVPATNWDASAAPDCCTTAEWYPTINYSARNNCSAPYYGEVMNSTYNYPFILNPNYDTERGLPVKITTYKDGGTTETSETNYTYQRYPHSPTPGMIYAFKYEDNPGSGLDVKAYNKYIIYNNIGELSATANTKVFDAAGAGTYQSSTATYTYGSSNHKLLTQQAMTNSDGSVMTTKIAYVKDYSASAGTNVNVNALYYLQQQNINAPVESYQQITSSGTTKITGAALTLFNTFTEGGGTFYLPAQQLKLVQPDGITNFVPFTVSGQTTTVDSRYFPVINYDTYDYSGYLLTADDAHHHISTRFIDHNTYMPVASFTNASSTESAFTDFDSHLYTPVFTISGTGSYTPIGSHTGKAAGLATTQTVTSSTLARNAIAQNYVFSIWINAVTAGTLTLTLTGISTHPTLSYAGGWRYYEISIPKSTLSSSYTVSFTSSQNISIDDILFYPGVAEVTTASYNDTTLFKTSQTNTNGISSYYINDVWGRNLYGYDRNRSIVQKNTYVTTQQIADFNNLSITSSSSFTHNVPGSVSVSLDIPSGATVKWDFADGSTDVTTPVTVTTQHTYADTGKFIITATVKSPYLGNKVVTKIVHVGLGQVSLSYTSYTTGYGDISLVTFTKTGTDTVYYSFTGAQLPTAKVNQGTYNINVVVTDGKKYPYPAGGSGGYNSVSLINGTFAPCINYNVDNNYTFNSVNLYNLTTLNFTVSQLVCSPED